MFSGLKFTASSIWKLLHSAKGVKKNPRTSERPKKKKKLKKRLFVLDLEAGPGELLLGCCATKGR